MIHFKYKDFKKCLALVWMSDGRAAVLCLLCRLILFILFWFSMCFRYIVYSYISPSLFLSCSFASFCSPSKSHKVSLLLFFLLLTLRGRFPRRAVIILSGQDIWNSLWPVLHTPSPSPAMCLYICVSDCLCVCPVAAQPQGCWKPSHSIEMPLGMPQGAEQEPISALRASWNQPLHEPSPRRIAYAPTRVFLPQSYMQWFTGEVQFQVNLIKSVTVCTGPLNPEPRAICSTELQLSFIAGILM